MYKLFLRNEREAEDARSYLSTKKLQLHQADVVIALQRKSLQKLKSYYLLGIVLRFRVNPAFSFHNFCSHFLLHSHLQHNVVTYDVRTSVYPSVSLTTYTPHTWGSKSTSCLRASSFRYPRVPRLILSLQYCFS